MNKLVDAYNTLLSTIGSLTASGGDGAARGILTGDSSVTAIKGMLNSALRARFKLEGLDSIDSIDAIKSTGNETLVFSAGRHFKSPLAVTLTEGASTEDILHRFNVSLGQEGLRAELDERALVRADVEALLDTFHFSPDDLQR